MITKHLEIKIKDGLEPGTIAMFIQTASQFESSVYVEAGTTRVNAKSLMGMMTLGMPQGEKISVTVDGSDEKKAMEAIEAFLTR